MLGIKKPSTVAKYCNYICDCYLYKQLKQFSWSVKKQERSLVKYYCVDTVMARMNGFNFSPDKGKELESQVLIELCKREGEVYYWTSKKGYGVDFIVLRPGSKFAMT